MTQWRTRFATVVRSAALVALVAGFIRYRRWHINWGASCDEINATMPGDEVVEAPTSNATRALTIKAPPEAIWPWIAQIGFGRAGWYSYDLGW